MVNSIAVAQRQGFDAARRGRFERAERYLHDAANAAGDDLTQGWLLEQAAAMLHPLDKARSQQILCAAHDRNGLVTRPIQGISYRRMDTAGMDQARQAAVHLLQTYRAAATTLSSASTGCSTILNSGMTTTRPLSRP